MFSKRLFSGPLKLTITWRRVLVQLQFILKIRLSDNLFNLEQTSSHKVQLSLITAQNMHLIFYHTVPTFNDPEERAFSKHCGKKRKWWYPAISSFPTMFSIFSGPHFTICITFNLSSANAFKLDWSKISLLDKESNPFWKQTWWFDVCKVTELQNSDARKKHWKKVSLLQPSRIEPAPVRSQVRQATSKATLEKGIKELKVVWNKSTACWCQSWLQLSGL